MRKFLLLQLVALTALMLGTVAKADTRDEILALTKSWASAISAGNLDELMSLYATDAVARVNFSSEHLTGSNEIRGYYQTLMQRKPRYTITKAEDIKEFGELAASSGFYTIQLGKDKPIKARYSFVFRNQDGKWLILIQHNSRVPEDSRR